MTGPGAYVSSGGRRSAWRGLVVLLALVVVSDCGASVGSGIESANDLLYKKQYLAAARLYHKLLKRLGEEGQLNDHEDAQRLLILDRLGKINALYLHDYAQAIDFYEKLVKLYPKTEQAFAARAMVADVYHHKLGKLEAAVSEYQKLIAEFPERSETRWAQLQISGAFFQLRNYEQARTEAEALINRWPDSGEAAQARFQIANSYYVQGRYAEAIATYERLLENNPDPSLASLVLFELGNCFQEVDDSDRALAYYYACLADHPNPLLVQRKIRRVRTRLRHARPSEGVPLPAYVEKRLAIAQRQGLAPHGPNPLALAQLPPPSLAGDEELDEATSRDDGLALLRPEMSRPWCIGATWPPVTPTLAMPGSSELDSNNGGSASAPALTSAVTPPTPASARTGAKTTAAFPEPTARPGARTTPAATQSSGNAAAAPSRPARTPAARTTTPAPAALAAPDPAASGTPSQARPAPPPAASGTPSQARPAPDSAAPPPDVTPSPAAPPSSGPAAPPAASPVHPAAPATPSSGAAPPTPSAAP